MNITTNFESMVPGTVGDPTTYNNNLAKIQDYLNDVISYVEEFMSDLSGNGQGIVSGGEITDGGGITLNAAAVVAAWIGGERITADAAIVNLNDDDDNYIYLTNNGEYEVLDSFAYYTNKIPRAKVITVSGDISTLEVYDNKIFTMNEMILNRILPLGLMVYENNGQYICNVSYIDPDITGLEEIIVEGSDDDGDTWSSITTITI
jgi:hypothetical protein